MPEKNFEEQMMGKNISENKKDGEWCNCKGVDYHVFKDGRKECLECHKLKNEEDIEKCDHSV